VSLAHDMSAVVAHDMSAFQQREVGLQLEWRDEGLPGSCSGESDEDPRGDSESNR